MSSTVGYRLVRSGLLVAVRLLAAMAAFAPAKAADAPICRELERKFDLLKSDIASTQLSLLLFAAADSGCVPLSRRLLDSGASLEARDRLGAMPLARAARAGHVALIELFLKQGAAIDARNLVGATALYAAAENERQASVVLLLATGADPNLPRLRRRHSRAMIESSLSSSPARPMLTSRIRPARRP
jgi:uncharacterized protein